MARGTLPPESPHRAEVSPNDPKAFALADDCTLLLEMSVDNIRNVIQILENFEHISGLSCNIKKTALMQVGSNEPIPSEITDLGLEIKNEITLLGAKITNSSKCFELNGSEVLNKIKKKINFWKRFNLSLPGRISISKTFLYSQINYLGCFLPFSVTDLHKFENEIETYTAGKIKISKERFYQHQNNGGLGLFKLDKFLASQCCSWFKRASTPDDLWKKELYKYSYNNVSDINPNFLTK